MSKLTNMVKKGTLLSIIIAVVIVAGIVIGAIFGFNASNSLENTKTLTVSMNKYVYNTKLDEVQSECENAFGGLKVLYELKSEMTGDDCEIMYVFAQDADLSAVESALKTTFAEETAEGGSLEGAFISVSAGSENVSGVLTKGYVLRGVIAAVVIAVLAFAYVAIRHSLGMGIVAAVCSLVGAALTSSIVLLTRIPVTSAVAYAIAIGGLVSLVTTILTLNKVHANLDAEKPVAETVAASVPVSEIAWLAILGGVAMLLVALLSVIGAGAVTTAVWFAIACIVALAVAAFVGMIYAPALYVPLKGCVDKKLGSSATAYAYIGAKKTSTKVKKIFAKKEEAKEEAAVEEKAEEVKEAPCCGCGKSCEEACEEPAEEAAEEVVEETEEIVEEAEEAVEEATEVAAEEAVEETTVEVAEEETESEGNND